MNDKKLRLGLIGKDVSKSKSERIHRFILREWGIDCEYQNFSIEKEDFDSVMRVLIGDFDGFNVTIPYKRDVMGYLNEIEGDALSCGAVNTVHAHSLTGYNTDGEGFLLMLRVAGVVLLNKKVLVLGGGGAGRSTVVALKNAGAEISVYQRNQEKLAELCEQLKVSAVQNPEEGGYEIIINCTGVGMHDTVGSSPVSAKAFQGCEWAIDLIYEPKISAFLQIAESQGLKTLNGESMLFYQAYFADCLYTGRESSVVEAKMLYEKFLQEQE